MLIRLTLVVVALAFAWMAPSSPARSQSGMVPGGSYLNSCKDVRYDPATHMLSADCERNAPGGLMAQGEKVDRPPLNISGCAENSIWNDDGDLYCLAAKPWGYGHVVPKGSYIETCSNRRVVNNVLLAECGTGSEGSRTTELNLNGCTWGADISNNHGQLECQPVIGSAAREFQPSGSEPETGGLVKPVTVQPLVKPVAISPAEPASSPPTGDKKGRNKKDRKDRGERG